MSTCHSEISDDIKATLYNYCKDYLSDVWSSIDLSEMIIEQTSGGCINQIFHCILPKYKQSQAKANDIPHEVVIRLYFKSYKQNRTDDMVTARFASVNNLAPKIYGVFNDGEIQEFVKVSYTFQFQFNNNFSLIIVIF